MSSRGGTTALGGPVIAPDRGGRVARPGELVERGAPAFLLASLLFIAHSPLDGVIDLAPWPFLIALVVLGLAHGAADGTLMFRGRGVRLALGPALRYTALLAASGGAFWVAPAPSSLAFFLLTVIHFGAADAESDLPAGSSSSSRHLWTVVRGGIVIGVPFLVNPDAAWRPFERLASLLGREADPSSLLLQWIGASTSLLAIGAALTIAARRRATDAPSPGAWLETALLVLLCVTTDPLFAVGAYFLAVHGFRQSARLGAQLAPSAGPPGSLWTRLRRTHVAALPLLVPSWILLAATALAVDARTPYDVASLSLGLYIAATLPHHLLHSGSSGPSEGTDS